MSHLVAFFIIIWEPPTPKASALPNIILCQCGTHLMFLSTNDMKHFLIYSFHTNELFSAMRFREYYKDLKDAFWQQIHENIFYIQTCIGKIPCRIMQFKMRYICMREEAHWLDMSLLKSHPAIKSLRFCSRQTHRITIGGSGCLVTSANFSFNKSPLSE